MDFLTTLFGRFHPLLVHLPIGILLLAFLFECLSARPRYNGLRTAVSPALFWGMLFAVASGISGYFLRQEGGYEEDLADIHQYFGIATAVLAVATYFLRRRFKQWFADPVKRKRARIALFTPLILSLLITGHWGGSLTHGEDYLFAAMAFTNYEDMDPTVSIRAIDSIPDAVLYRDVVQPILQARCYDCHSSSKQKGDLRLDTEEYILRGGKNGRVISDGPADSSALYKRLMLPLEDEEHMPPNEKKQLTSSQIALVKFWLEEKPLFTKKIGACESEEKITTIIEALQVAPLESWIPGGEAKPAREKELQDLQAHGLVAMPLAEGNPYLMVSLANHRTLTGEQIKALLAIREQLVWLNANFSTLTEPQLKELSGLTNLRVLYLNETPLTDEGLAALAPLSELRILSLVGTKVTDAALPVLLDFKKLTHLYLFRTAVTREAVAKIVSREQRVSVDTGNYQLKKLPTDTVFYKRVSGDQ